MYAGTRKIIDGQTCNATATIYSLVPEEDLAQSTNSWIRCGAGESFTVWVSGVSSGGTINVDVYIDISPLNESIAYNSSDTTKYYAVKCTSAAALATDSTLTPYYPDELDYPFCKYRVRVVGTASNPSDSIITAYVTSAK